MKQVAQSETGGLKAMTDAGASPAAPFACDLHALAPVDRDRHIAATLTLFGAVQGVVELSNGYAFHLPDQPPLLRLAAEFIIKERLCCPFFGFAVEIEPEGGALWLRLTGREGIKPFIQAEFGQALAQPIALVAGWQADAL